MFLHVEESIIILWLLINTLLIITAPASSPQNVMTIVLSSTEILVNWTEVSEIDQNGMIITYEVMHDPLMTFNGMLSKITVNTTNLSITLNNLQEYVEYNISVRAYTNVGPGPYSLEIVNRTLENGEIIGGQL